MKGGVNLVKRFFFQKKCLKKAVLKMAAVLLRRIETKEGSAVYRIQLIGYSSREEFFSLLNS